MDPIRAFVVYSTSSSTGKSGVVGGRRGSREFLGAKLGCGGLTCLWGDVAVQRSLAGRATQVAKVRFQGNTANITSSICTAIKSRHLLDLACSNVHDHDHEHEHEFVTTMLYFHADNDLKKDQTINHYLRYSA